MKPRFGALIKANLAGILNGCCGWEFWRNQATAQAKNPRSQDCCEFDHAVVGTHVVGIRWIDAGSHRALRKEAMPATTFALRPVCCLATD